MTESDNRFLTRAIELAGRGGCAVKPNPLVGAVVVRDDEVLGEGWHAELGGDHAEVAAIGAAAGAGADLRGATMYVSLEPCCHHGRTPPCTDAILAAGITRLVVAADDPSEKANGRGLGILRDEGVSVEIAGGELAARARRHNQPFRKHARTGLPWVVFKSAMTLDGKVATRTGDSQWISSELSRRRAHEWRACADAVAVGIGTALADDPQLTARVTLPGGREPRQPRRVVFDATARLSPASKLVADAPEVPLTVVVSRAAPRAASEALAGAGAEILIATGANEPARVTSALAHLGEQGVTSVLLEGGPHLAGAFMDAGQIDELRIFLAPLLVGGRGASDPIGGSGVDRIADALHAQHLRCEAVGPDLLISATIKEW